jgi:hypothetical protein
MEMEGHQVLKWIKSEVSSRTDAWDPWPYTAENASEDFPRKLTERFLGKSVREDREGKPGGGG